ncbi:hypothetical protein BGZ58_009130 [Dissophora ornata]|nr:hypothetical protein BGZ58_009130 [Dissophora ornata]
MSNSELQSQRTRDVVCAELDGALTAWIRENQERNLHVSYKMIIGKATELAAYIRTIPGKTDAKMPAFSNGWVSGFTKRNMFVGSYLNAPGVSSAAAAAVAAGSPVSGADGASAVGPDVRPFSTNEQLVLQAIAAQQAKANRELNAEMDYDMMEGDGDEDMGSTSMEDIVSDIQTDLHHQVVHAVARDISPAVASTSAPTAAATATPIKKPRGRRPRSTAPQQRDSNKSTVQQVQQQEQHQIHQATTGLVSASATGDRAADMGVVAPPAMTTFNIATAAPATPSTSTSTTTRPTPSTAEALAAVRVVIESLNVHIPAEADLLRPLFDMERRLYNQINAERPNTLLNWVK